MPDQRAASLSQSQRDGAPRDRDAGSAGRRPTAPYDRWVLRAVQAALGDAPVRFALWDGTSCYRLDAEPVATVRFADRRALWGLLWNRDIGFGDGFRSGRVTVDGNLAGAIEAVFRAVKQQPPRDRALRRRRPSNTVHRAQANVHHHYDLGNDFYSLWLDRHMVYTCAYYASPEMTLEDAQRAKLDYVCRKLRLRADERVVEAGCGWGALTLHMVRHYGVTVRAFNISREQVDYARHRARVAGLAGRVEFIEEDYRNVGGQCDAFVSVGMLEHVGPDHYAALGEVINRCLPATGGRGLLHFIGRNRPRPLNAWIRKRVFPGAYPPTIAEVAEAIFEPGDVSVLDVENLRLHYARTCADWLARFEAVEDAVTEQLGPELYRTWQLYLAGSQASFTAGWMQLFQITFARGGDNAVPWTRVDLYRDAPPLNE